MAENKDMCVRCGEGVINIRVGAIITKDNHVLMVRNNRDNFFIGICIGHWFLCF